MSANGFSVPVSFWGSISGLTVKNSEEGYHIELATAQDSNGDTIAAENYGGTYAPKSTYVVTGEVNLANLALGTVYTGEIGGINRKFMLTNVVIETGAGESPTVTLSGTEVESSAVTQRTYRLCGTLTPRVRSQDVAGAFANTSENMKSVKTEFDCNVAEATVSGIPVASGVCNARVTVSATFIDPDKTLEVRLGQGFLYSNDLNVVRNDASYIEYQAEAVRYLNPDGEINDGE
ncbi:MAG: hypothetical protein J6Z49_06920 [Kiritimatiellae bacterium]|nr:hypothetical protein [Kiritimatiellia bacterium]